MRAVVGVGKATVGAAVAIAATKVALTATDGICAAIAQSAGTSVTGAARRFLDLTWLAGPGTGPVLQMLLASAVMVGVVLLWGVLLFRKAAILLVAVFAPIAFAGSAWDQTRVWTRRWIEAVIALVFCKVVIVVVFVLGAAAFGSTGSTGTGASQALGTQLSDVMVGLLLLGLAVFAPWMTFRFVHWSGMEAGTALHHQMVATPIPAAATGAARSGRFAAQSAATTMLVGAVTGGAGAPAAAAATAARPACSCGGRGRGGGWAVSDPGVRFGRLEQRGLLLGAVGGAGVPLRVGPGGGGARRVHRRPAGGDRRRPVLGAHPGGGPGPGEGPPGCAVAADLGRLPGPPCAWGERGNALSRPPGFDRVPVSARRLCGSPAGRPGSSLWTVPDIRPGPGP